MNLSILNIINFRNIKNLSISPNPSCNIFHGTNGSGKTSILESIYYIAIGRSFRSHLLRRIINYDADKFSIFTKIQQQNNTISIGLERSVAAGKNIKIAGEKISSSIEITKLLPIQLLNQHSFALLEGTPKLRRQFIDWGLFHVKHGFIDLWRRVGHIIEQRNTAIRSKNSADYILSWNKELVKHGLELHLLRKKYIEELTPIAQAAIQQLLPDLSIKISYFPGWDTQKELEQLLSDNLQTDLKLGYTNVGPHRADIKLTIENIPTKDTLSRGQQKLLVYGLQIAQGLFLNDTTNKKCIYLVDDLPAELDIQKRILLSRALLNLNTQLYVTGLIKNELEKLFEIHNKQLFHVEQGGIIPN